MGVFENDKTRFHLYKAFFEGGRVVKAEPMGQVIEDMEYRVPGNPVIELK